MHTQSASQLAPAKKPGCRTNSRIKSKNTAFLLWFFLGIFSIHRFYLGKTISGIVYLLTGQLLFIGWAVDLFILGDLVEAYNNKIVKAAPAPAESTLAA